MDTTGSDTFISELVTLAHSKNKKVIVSIGGAGEAGKAFLSIAKSEQALAYFVKNVIEYVDAHALDGVDIDWEYWSYQSVHGKGGNDPVESQQLVYLLKTLKQALPSRKLLTVDIAAGHWFGGQYLPELQQYADFINLMAFDFTGAWPDSAVGYHSSYDLFEKAIDSTIDRGFEKSKLLVGLPAYGIEFINGKNASIKHHSYNTIVELLNRDQSALAREKAGNLYFESSASIAKKAKYIQARGLGGAFIFEITSDHHEREYRLFESLSSDLHPNGCIP